MEINHSSWDSAWTSGVPKTEFLTYVYRDYYPETMAGTAGTSRLDPSMMCSNDLSGSSLCTTTLWNVLGDSLDEFSMPSGKNEITHHLNIVSYFSFRVSHPFLWSVQIYISKNFQNQEKAVKRLFQPSQRSAVSWRLLIFSYANPFYLNRGLKRQT